MIDQRGNYGMRITAISDIHGHYDEMKAALDGAGFRAGDPSHLLVVCGDCFDRGNRNKDVFRFLSSVENKVIVKGNHEDMLEAALNKRRLDGYDFLNGVDKTVLEFLKDDEGELMSFPEITHAIKNDYLPFLSSTRNWFETGNHIFVHGWLPSDYDEDGKLRLIDYKTATERQWFDARWMSWEEAIVNDLMYEGKKNVVCGHWSTSAAFEFDRERERGDSSIFRYKNFTAIDANVMTSGRINALVIEDGF